MFRMLRTLLATIVAVIATLALANTALAHDYTVEEGDTLSEIATEWGVPGGWQSIYEWNDNEIDDPNLIYPGQTFHLEEHRHVGDGNGKPSRSGKRDEPKRAKADELKQNSGDNGGEKVRPATGSITSPYLGGYRKNGGHSGTDFDGADGYAYAAADGVVKAGFWDGAYGNKLVIDHGGGVETWYAHLSGFLVSVDQRVVAGQQVGYIGETGNTTGPHLHFEVRINGEMTDPMAWLSR